MKLLEAFETTDKEAFYRAISNYKDKYKRERIKIVKKCYWTSYEQKHYQLKIYKKGK